METYLGGEELTCNHGSTKQLKNVVQKFSFYNVTTDVQKTPSNTMEITLKP